MKKIIQLRNKINQSIFFSLKVPTTKYILALTIFMTSCYSTTEVELPLDKQFLVINSINFQPDSTWLIEVSKSQPFLSTSNHEAIENAQVYIKDEDGVEIQLEPVVINTRTYYASHHKPEIEKRYELSVHSPGFGSVKANSEIPNPQAISNLKIEVDSTYLKEVLENLKNNPGYPVNFTKHVLCKASFSDPPNDKNFYELRLFSGYTSTTGTLKHIELQFLDLNGARVTYLTEDTQFNGFVKSFEFYIPIANFLSSKKIYVSLRVLSPDYFSYQHTKSLQDGLSEDPFAQPVIVHNNIENGAGIFAGFSTLGWTLEKPATDNPE
jgi:hypothetical protein